MENPPRIRVVVTVTRPRPRHCYPLSSIFITCQVDDVRPCIELARITDGSWLSGVHGAVERSWALSQNVQKTFRTGKTLAQATQIRHGWPILDFARAFRCGPTPRIILGRHVSGRKEWKAAGKSAKVRG